MIDQVEEIPDGHQVSRYIDSPHKYVDDAGMIWPRVFAFPRGEGESVVWRHYLPSMGQVHETGCAREAHRRAQVPEKTPPWTYIGAISANVIAVRAIQNARGHGFVVEHKPYDEDGGDQGIHHAEISYRVLAGVPLTKNDKTELKELIQVVFGPIDFHTCA